MVSIIAAMAEGNRAIGLRGDLPWRLPADLAHFRRLTMGHTVIMGRVTWEPIAEPGLPGRRVIVLSSRDPLTIPGVETGLSPRPSEADHLPRVQAAGTLVEALLLADQQPQVFIAGGASVYRQALSADLVDRMYLTLVRAEVEGDRFFPEYDPADWSLTAEEHRPADAENPYALSFQTLDRNTEGQPGS